MSKPKIILIGAGGHSHSCIDVIEQQNKFDIAGLIGRPEELGILHFNYKVIATDEDLPLLAKTYDYALITIGQINSPRIRIHLYERSRELGFQFPVIVSPNAHVSRTARIGPGTIVFHGVIINSGSTVGLNCIINTRSLIEHDASIEDHCHISTGAILNGNVTVGKGSFVGSGSTIKEGVRIGSECLVGMGLTVRHDILDHTRFTGLDK
jgi:sugar O-acyltransferase (sialic acid O-acetyltransferase NeuD family)